MNSDEDKYWVAKFRNEAKQYSATGRSILANYDMVRVNKYTVKMVRRNATV